MRTTVGAVLRNLGLLSTALVVAGCQVPLSIAYHEGEKLEREFQRKVFADLPPAQPARDLRAIAGKWEGAILLRDGTYPATMTIKDDGSWEILAPALFRPGPRFVGSMKIVGDKYRYASDTTRRTGTYTVHGSGATRMLLGVSDDKVAYARYKPAANQPN